jgi:hypothetical protein
LRKLPLLMVALLIATTTAGTAQAKEPLKYPSNNAWIKLWDKRDVSIYPSMKVASSIFRVSHSTLLAINGGEGGNIHRDRLRITLCNPFALGYGGGGGVGWNNSGSSAFGPMQFMMDSKPACNANDWGTFGSYDDRAFQEAKRRGYPVPYRFKHPASNVGQAITTAYMVSRGGISHWCASMC